MSRENRQRLISNLLVVFFGLSLPIFAFAVESNFPTQDQYFKTVEIHIVPVARAISYRAEVTTILDSGKKNKPNFQESAILPLHLRLPPGLYEIRVQSIEKNLVKSEWTPPSQILIRLPNAQPIAPLPQQNIIATDDIATSINFRWKPVSNAAAYGLFVRDKNGKDLLSAKLINSTEAQISLPHKTTYQWLVRSYYREIDCDMDQLSSAQTPIFKQDSSASEASQSFRIGEYVKLNLSTAEEVSQLYAWGRYITSIENYQVDNQETGANLASSQFGGTGELGAGQWGHSSGRGWLVHGAWAGFNYNNVNYTYVDLGAQIGFRHIMADSVRLRWWLGASYNEVPEITVNTLDQVSYAKVRGIGPELKMALVNSFDELWGWQAFGTYFNGSHTIGTPNGKTDLRILTYSLSAMLTYNPKNIGSGVFKNFRWLMGYTYKSNTAKYKDIENTGYINSTGVQGHYLSLAIEFGLEEPVK